MGQIKHNCFYFILLLLLCYMNIDYENSESYGEVAKCIYLRTVLKYNFEVPLLYWGILIFHLSIIPLQILDSDIAPLFHYIYLIIEVTLQIAGCIRLTVAHSQKMYCMSNLKTKKY